MRDAIDRNILSLLLEDARRPLSDVARRVNLSLPSVTRRVARLERDGVIVGYSALLGPAALSWKIEAFVELICKDRTSPQDIARACEPHPEVVAAYTVTGDADALLHVRTGSTDDLEDCLQRIREDPHVVRTRTQLVLTRLFDRPSGLAELALE